MLVQCPSCGKRTEFPETSIGRPAKCNCGTLFQLEIGGKPYEFEEANPPSLSVQPVNPTEAARLLSEEFERADRMARCPLPAQERHHDHFNGNERMHVFAFKSTINVANSALKVAFADSVASARPDIAEQQSIKPENATPADFFFAVKYGDAHFVEELLNIHPGWINDGDDECWTVLFWAVIGNNQRVLELLLRRGADVNIADSQGLRPLDWAQLHGFDDASNLLRQTGAKTADSVAVSDSARKTADQIPPQSAPAAKRFDNRIFVWLLAAAGIVVMCVTFNAWRTRQGILARETEENQRIEAERNRVEQKLADAYSEASDLFRDGRKSGNWDAVVSGLTPPLTAFGDRESPIKESAKILLKEALENRAKIARLKSRLAEADALYSNKKYGDALDAYELVRKESTDAPQGFQLRAAQGCEKAKCKQRYYAAISEGQRALGERRWRDAENAFDKALELEPGDATADQGHMKAKEELENLRRSEQATLEAENRFTAALGDAKKKVALFETQPASQQDAEKAINAVLAIRPNDAEAKALLEKLNVTKELTLDLGGGVKMELVLVKAGEFQMGADDADAVTGEGPVHAVRITQPYYIGKYPVTVGQFKRFATATGIKTDAEKRGNGYTLVNKVWTLTNGANWRNPGFVQYDDHPVVLVSWNDTLEFIKWANTQTGRIVNLPSEAQWEYAARGPQNSKYPWGNAWDGTKANHADQSLEKSGKGANGASYSNRTDGYIFTNPVGKIMNASWCGAFDMSGNVWQWCQDTFDDTFYGSSKTNDPANNTQGVARVVRGGSWLTWSGNCRSAFRGHNTPGDYVDTGFRVVVGPSSDAMNPNKNPELVPAAKIEPVTDSKPGQTMTLDLGNSVKLELVLIKPGIFEMGSIGGGDMLSIQKQRHRVTISNAFYMSKYLVTQEQYKAMMNSNPSYFTPYKGGGPKNPVERVQWFSAAAFCKELSKLTGKKVELPTEAQWEYACRAGTKTWFYSGDDEADLARAGWYAKNSENKTNPVGQKVPNAFGLYDMHGNVYQWCQDVFATDYENLPATDPCNTAQGDRRVLRGGSWLSDPWRCRASDRHSNAPDTRDFNVGFRIVVSAPSSITP